MEEFKESKKHPWPTFFGTTLTGPCNLLFSWKIIIKARNNSNLIMQYARCKKCLLLLDCSVDLCFLIIVFRFGMRCLRDHPKHNLEVLLYHSWTVGFAWWWCQPVLLLIRQFLCMHYIELRERYNFQIIIDSFSSCFCLHLGAVICGVMFSTIFFCLLEQPTSR